MIDFALAAQRNEGKSPEDAIFEGCLQRFRPIMMTTMAALLGTLPIAFGTGAGGEARRPLGIAVVGGLVVSQLADALHHAGNLRLPRPLHPPQEEDRQFSGAANASRGSIPGKRSNAQNIRTLGPARRRKSSRPSNPSNALCTPLTAALLIRVVTAGAVVVASDAR